MGVVDDGLARAVQETFTRPIPKSAGAQMRYLVKQLKGTRTAAQQLGIAQHLEKAVRARWQPQIRARAKKEAATSRGVLISTRARFGFTAAPGATDDARMRRLTQILPPEYADQLFTAQEQGATEERLQQIAAEGLGHVYFRDGGRRAPDLEVEFTDIDYIDFSL